jgi:KaiC/GvpD/RAD55 family RecA-like ATPase
LEFRLKKTKAILIQIFVVMMSTESESAQIISTLQEMRFALDDAVQKAEKIADDAVQKTRSHLG